MIFTTGTYPILAIVLFLYSAHISFLTIHILPFMFQATNYIKAAMLFVLTYSLLIGVFACFGYNQSQLLVAIYAGYPLSAVFRPFRSTSILISHPLTLTSDFGNRRCLLPLRLTCSHSRQKPFHAAS
jgi:hypothetical protein